MAIDNNKLKQVYNTLKQGGYTQSYDEFAKGFSGHANYKNRQQVYDVLVKHGAKVGDTYQAFMDNLQLRKQPTQPQVQNAPRVVQDNSSTPQQVAPANPVQRVKDNAPMTEADKQRYMQGAQGVIADSYGALQQAKNRVDYAKGNTGLKVKPVKLGQNRNVVERKNANGTTDYLTEDGAAYGQRGVADLQQHAIDKERQDALNPVNAELETAYAERDRLDEALRARRTELDKQYQDQPWYQKLLQEGGKAVHSDINPMATAHDSENMGYENDEVYRQLMSAARKNHQTIATLEDKKQGKMNDFWHSFGKDMMSGYRLADGLPELRDAIAQQDAQKRLANINKKRAQGVALTKEEEAAEAVLRNNIIDDEIQAKYQGDYGAWARAGKMTVGSLDFMKDFMLFPGGTSMAKGIAKGVAGLGGKFLAKEAGEAALKAVPKMMARGLLKATGVLVGAHTAGAVIGNTTGLARTMGDAASQTAGSVVKDKDGNYQVVNQQELLPSIAGAERNAVRENGSEMFGEFIPGGKVIGKVITKGLEKIGLSKIAGALTSIGSKQWYNQYGKVLRAGGYNGIPGEAIEEYEGSLFDALTGHSKDAWRDMTDKRNHIDIWLGCATMGALFGAVPMIAQGHYTAQYYRYKHKADVADKQAAAKIGDKWTALREKIDGTDNGRMAQVVSEIIDSKDLSYRQTNAALNYVRNLTKMRGFNIAEANNANEIDNAPQQTKSVNESYGKGYDTTMPQDMNATRNMLDLRRAKVAKQLGVTEDEVDKVLGNPQVYIAEQQKQGNEEKAKVVADYANAKLAYDGMIQRVRDDIDAQVTASNDALDAQTNLKTGVIQPATMKVDDRQVYVVNGRIALREDGTIDTEQSDKSVVVRDAETGKEEQVSPQTIFKLGEATPAAQVKEAAAQQIRQSYAEEQSNHIDGVLQFLQGDTYSVLGEDGTAHSVQVIGDAVDERQQPVSGSVMVSVDGGAAVAMPKEQVQAMSEAFDMQQVAQQDEAHVHPQPTKQYELNEELTLRGENGEPIQATVTAVPYGEGKYEVATDQPIAGKRVNIFTAEELAQMDMNHDDVQGEMEVHNEEDGQLQAGGTDGVSDTPVAREDDKGLTGGTQAEKREPMPMVGAGIDAEPDFSQVTPTRAHAYIYDEAGLTKEEANAFVAANLKQANDVLSRVEKKKPVMGLSMAKYRQQQAIYSQQVEEAQASVDYWRAVKGAQDKINAEENQRLAAQQAEDTRRAQAEEKERQQQVLQKEAEEAARGAHRAAPAIRERWDNTPKIDGVPNEIVLPNGEKVSGHYVLTESGAASASHNATSEFAKTDGFPTDENGQSVNDRDYERDKDAQRVTRQIASAYDSRALQTPVVVSQDGVVLSGNGRTMAGELAAANNSDGAYIDYLRHYPQQYGFTPEQVSSMQHPRVVFVPDMEMPYNAETFAKFNQQEMKGQSKTEQAVKLGKVVDDTTFNRITRSINSYDTLGEFYADTNATREAVKELQRAGVVSHAQVAELFDGEGLSAQGKEVLENMLIGKAFESNPDAVREITAYKSVRQTIITALAEIVNNKSLGVDYSLETELSQAIDLVYKARKAGQKSGERVSSFARQQNIFTFDEGDTVADYTNATMLMLSDVLNDTRSTQLKKILAVYNQNAADSAAGQLDVFSGGVKDKENIWNEVKQLIDYGTEEEQQQAINDATERRKARIQEDEPTGSSGDENRGIDEGGYTLSDKRAYNGEYFYQDINGNIDLADIPSSIFVAIGKPKAPFRLTPSMLEHVFNRHGKEMGLSQADDAIDFVLDVMDNFDHVRQGDKGAIVFSIENGRSRTGRRAVTILLDSRSGEYYGIKTSGYERIEGLTKRPLLWEKGAIETSTTGVAPANVTTEQAQQGNELTGSASNQSRGSAGKDSKQIDTKQENGQENLQDKEIQGLEGYSETELKDMFRGDVEAMLEEAGIEDVTIDDIAIHGSRARGTAKPHSDLDVVVAYSGDLREDDFFNLLHEEPHEINGIIIDFNPIREDESGSLKEYMQRSKAYDEQQLKREAEEAKVDTNPTEKQKEAGNYKKGHIKVDGFDITIEQPKGSVRRGTDANGKEWETEMHNTYGYIKGTEGVDGDHIDIFLSDNPTEGNVYVVDQVNKDGSFDEHKVMYGFPNVESAKQAYLSNYEDGWQGLGNITEVSKEDFKKWINSSKRKTKPFAEYTSVKTQDDTQAKKATEENAAPTNTQTKENNAHNSKEIMHEQKNVQLQQAINAHENAKREFTKFHYQQLKEGKLGKAFESEQWRDVLRKQTELQKALLQLNSEELKELLKQTTNEDTKKEIEKVLYEVLRQEQQSIEYNAVLDKQEPITPIYKEEKKPIAVTEFVETDKEEAEIRPVLTGVYHDDGYVVGTNAHILLARKEDYDKSLEGKITNKKGEVIDGKYPNWRAVVEGETTTNSWGINLDELHAFVRGVLAKLKADGAKKNTIDSAIIAFKDTDGKIIVCNAKTLEKALRGAKSIGATEFGNKSETFAHAQTKKGYVVCPTISTYHSINDNCFVYAPKEAARQQTTATLTNDTEAKQKATEAVLAALSKAGIEVVRATDEEVKVLLSNSHATTLRTPQGTIYGWSVNGKIYLTEAGINPDTPIHEYTHLWAEAMMKQNKQGWNSIKSLLKDTPVWKEVIADPNYSNIKDNEDAVANEVLSRISGRKNAAKMEAEAQKTINEAKGVLEKANATTILLNLKRAIKQFWHWVGKNVFGIKDFKNIDEVTDRVLYDLLSNTKLTEEDNEEIAKRDKLYLDAVERGDMETAQRMVNEAAAQNGYVPNSEYQGSSAFNGAAPYGNGYFLTKEERKGAYENDEFDGDTSLDDYVNSGIDPMNLDYLTNDSSYRHADDARKEAIENLRNVFQNKRQTITMYRSVPSSIKEGSFRNGDWVTPSYAYAVENARVHGWGNKYRIIEQEVPISDVWFDGNDIAEFGYGNEDDFINDKDYLYSNTKNNQKLPDAVTYDDKGNVIPLSKRFNKAKSDPRFQITDSALSDEEKKIVETTKANDTYMKAPNGKPTNLSEKQWAQVRTKAFKDWFGDWEKAARIEKLRRSKAVKITGEEIEPNSDLKQYKKNALEYGKNLRGEYTNKDTGETIALTGGNSRGGMREILQHDYKDIEHLQSIAAIPQIIEKAIFVDEAPNEDAERYPGVKSFRYYVCGLKIGNTNYTVKAVVAVQNNGDRYCDHKLSSIEKGKLLSIIPTIQKAGIENNLPPSVGKDKRLLSILQTNSSKVVDENGEPMVVYHGSNNEFTQFDTARIGSSTGTSDGRGFYFTTDKNYAHTFSKDSNVIDVFLNITNPLSLKEKTITKGQLFDIIKRIDEKEFAADGEHWLVSNYGNYYDIGIDGAIKEAVENEYPYSDNDVELVNSLISASGDFEKVVDSVYETTGKSGEIVPKDNGTIHYVVTSPNQIKSATNNNGHFSVAEDDIRYRAFGGNSGYVGYSMSKRAARARNEGRYPKGDFKKEYHLTEKAFEVLDDIGMIDRGEWHHTSMYGNRTKFYGWVKPWMADAYMENKSAIDKLVREVGVNNDDAIERLMEDSKAHQAYLVKEEGERRKQETAAHLNALHKEYEQEMSKLIPKEIAVSNGVIVHTDEKDWYATKDGVRLSKRNGKELRNAALEEAKELSKPNVTFEDWLSKREHNELQSVNKAFNEALDELKAENAQQSRLELGNPSAELLSVGVPNKPIILYRNKLLKKSRLHGFALEALHDLPLAIQHPIAIFQGSHPDSFATLLSLQLNGHHVLASIEINKKGEADFNIISSVFGKEDKGVVKWILDGKLLRVDKEKAQTYISASALHADATYKNELTSAAKIVESFDNPSIEVENLRDGDDISYDAAALSEHNDPYVKMLGHGVRSKEQQRQFAERERHRMVDRVRELADHLHLNDVEVVTDSKALSGNRATAKGFYNTATGKITIVIPNHHSIEDVEQTLLHEAVAHYGLRRLFGERFDTFLDNVYENAHPYVRSRIDALAYKHDWNTRTATEEYLASLAENTNFEQLPDDFWHKIKDWFLQMLRSIGLKNWTIGHYITDNELRYLLWRSYENLSEPGRYRNVFAEAADIAKQHVLKVGNYATHDIRGEAAADMVIGRSKDNTVLYRGAKDSEPVRTAKEIYEAAVTDAGDASLVGALARMLYKWDSDGQKKWFSREAREEFKHKFSESYFDFSRSIKQLQDAIQESLDVKLAGFEDVWRSLNAKGSVDAQEVNLAMLRYVMPLSEYLGEMTKDKQMDGKTLNEDDVERYMNAVHGIERNSVLQEREFKKGLLAKLKRQGYTPEEREMIAEGELINRRNGKGDVEFDDLWNDTRIDYSGFTALFGDQVEDVGDVDALEAAAHQYATAFEAVVGKEQTEKMWELVNALNSFSLRKSYLSGLISKSQYDDVQKMYNHYVPLRGWHDNYAGDVYQYISRGDNGGAIQKVLKKAKGRKSRAGNILGTMAAMANSAITQGNKNLVAQKFMNLALNYGDKSGLLMVGQQWYEENADGELVPLHPNLTDGMTIEQQRDEIDRFEKSMIEKEADGKAKVMRKTFGKELPLHLSQWEEQEHCVRVLRNGVEYMVYVLGNPRAAQAFNGLLNNRSEVSSIGKAIGAWMRFKATMQTSLSPEFILSNFQRDLLTAQTGTYVKFGGRAAWAFNRNLRSVLPIGGVTNGHMGGIFTLLKKYEVGTLNKNDDVERMFDEFVRNGGMTGVSVIEGVDDYQRKAKKLMARVHRGRLDTPRQALQGLADAVEFVNSGIENATRFAAYMTSRETLGKEIAESVFDAKEASVNFNMKGSGAWGNLWMRRYIMYANPALQSLRMLGTLYDASPKRFMQAFGVIMAASIGTALLWSMVGGGDGDGDDNDWYKLSEWNRYNYINIRTGGGYAHWSLPQEFRPVWAMGQIVFDWSNGMVTKERAISSMLVQLNNLSPMAFFAGGSDSKDSYWETAIRAFTPTVMADFIDAYGWNENFLGQPITNQTDWNKDAPEYQRAGRNTPQWAVNISEKWNDVTGGAPNRKSWFDSKYLNPSAVYYILQQQVGGMGTMVTKLSKAVEQYNDPNEDVEAKNIPFVSKLWVSTEDKQSKNRVIDDKFWMIYNDWNLVDYEIKHNKASVDNGTMTLEALASRMDAMMKDGDYQRWASLQSLMKDYNKLKRAKKDGQLVDDQMDALKRQVVMLVEQQGNVERKE